MRSSFLLAIAVVLALSPAEVLAQRNPKKEAAFLVTRPVVGDPLPEVTVYTPDGKEFKTAELRGHYTVLTFGCLT
jgi:cytochrome oxidase Cu insertion factor (SCO1/SenC/PrrC family)